MNKLLLLNKVTTLITKIAVTQNTDSNLLDL